MNTSNFTQNNILKRLIGGITLILFLSISAHANEYAEITKLLDSSRFIEALNRTEQHLKAKPRDTQMQFTRGVVLTQLGRNSEAIAAFTKITEEFPELPEPFNNLAVLYANQNQFNKARDLLEIAIRTNPSYATAQENLGDIYARMASQAYSKALQIDSKNIAVQPKLALIKSLFNPVQKERLSEIETLAPVHSVQTPPVVSIPSVISSPSRQAPPPAQLTAKQSTNTNISNPEKATTGVTPELEVANAVRDWATAWSNKDFEAYLKSYSRDFIVPGKRSRQAWAQERSDRILGKSKINVEIDDLNIKVNNNQAIARFLQHYKADGLDIRSRKVLTLVFSEQGWLILREAEI